MTPPARSALVLVAALLAAGSPGRADDRWEVAFPGVRHLNRVTGAQNLHVLLVDLCAAGVSARGTRVEESGRTVAAHGAALGAQAVVNGDFYNPSNPRQLDGPSMGAGALWGGPDHGYVGPVGFGAGRAAVTFHGLTAGVEPWMREVVSGHPTLITDGRRVDNNGDAGLCVARHPRTAIGLSRDRHTLIVAVVDGRATGRAGMTCDELGDLLAEFGAHDATNLDGGGSSAMWLAGRGVVNRPSDGALRRPGNHLALFARGSGASPHCPAPRCTARCDGAVLIGDDCGRGDCAAYGARCVAEGASARCVFGACPATGTLRACVDERRIVTCTRGAPSDLGDCGAFAAFCSTAGGRPARCVSIFCAADANAPPRASRSCWLEPGRIAVCDADGGFALEDCPAGQQCAAAGGVRCVPAVCPASGESVACVDDRWLGQCRGGTVVEATDCQRFGGRCARGPGGAACEAPDAGVADAGVTDGAAADAPAVDAPADAPRDAPGDVAAPVGDARRPRSKAGAGAARRRSPGAAARRSRSRSR